MKMFCIALCKSVLVQESSYVNPRLWLVLNWREIFKLLYVNTHFVLYLITE